MEHVNRSQLDKELAQLELRLQREMVRLVGERANKSEIERFAEWLRRLERDLTERAKEIDDEKLDRDAVKSVIREELSEASKATLSGRQNVFQVVLLITTLISTASGLVVILVSQS